MSRPRLIPHAFALALVVSACATVPPQSDPEARAEYFERNDPLEPLNRAVFAFNEAFDHLLFRPAAETYRTLVPKPVRTGVGNVIDNLLVPRTAANQLLQGRPDDAAKSIARFLINSTLGVLGIFDVASEMGLEPQFEDFGQTLAVWAGTTNGGPFLMLPILGPSTLRDAFALPIDMAMDPWNWVGQGDQVQALRLGRYAVQAIDGREQLIEPIDALRAQSLDFYSALRSVYLQRRERDIRNEGRPAARRFVDDR
ncbi:MAG: VacJ family lipoprotein [Elioraea sp.]|nr:VacJ family lipoprotein [Elioraea sp.]